MLEIERRYVLLSENAIKTLLLKPQQYNPLQMNQFYAKGFSYRLRASTELSGLTKYYQTIKIGKGIVREEVEVELTAEQFNVMLKATKYELVKTRYTWNEVTFDVFPINIETKRYSGPLVIAEKEFPTVKEAKEYNFPYFSIEITELITNYMLAKDFNSTIEIITNLVNHS